MCSLVGTHLVWWLLIPAPRRAQGNEGLTTVPTELTNLTSLKRCNLGAAGPADLIDKLMDLTLDKPDGIFWDKDGKMTKPEDRPAKKKAAGGKDKRAASPAKTRPGGGSSARGSSPKRAASPAGGKRAATPPKGRPGK